MRRYDGGPTIATDSAENGPRRAIFPVPIIHSSPPARRHDPAASAASDAEIAHFLRYLALLRSMISVSDYATLARSLACKSCLQHLLDLLNRVWW